jgi:hypothetical protein
VYPDSHTRVSFDVVMRHLAVVLVIGGCVGDATSGSDAGMDASSDGNAVDVQGDVGTTDAGADGDAASCPPPSTSLTSNCSAPKVACLRQNQPTCDAPGNCIYLSGGRQLLCGSTGDCDGGAACCTVSATVASTGCPEVVSMNSDVTNFATQCSTSTTKTCAASDLQVCLTTAECATGTCQGAVFDVNGTQVVKLGVCR